MADSHHLIDLTKFKFFICPVKVNELYSKGWLNQRENDKD